MNLSLKYETRIKITEIECKIVYLHWSLYQPNRLFLYSLVANLADRTHKDDFEFDLSAIPSLTGVQEIYPKMTSMMDLWVSFRR